MAQGNKPIEIYVEGLSMSGIETACANVVWSD